jgi:predicted lipoprotein with Yx(FWY)xxD motif
MIRSTRIGFLSAAAAVPLAALAVAGCGGGNDGSASTAPPASVSGRPATVGVANEGDLGKILVDSHGRTLYLFEKDSGTKSTCFGECASDWPPLRAASAPTVGHGANASLVSTTARSDGNAEITYNGHPLYLFEGDKQPGDTNGQGLTAFGGGWFALSPVGTQVLGKASSSGAGASSSGGGSAY